jgi:hypothetical protein
MATNVLSCLGFHPTTLLGPSTPHRHSTKIAESSSWTSIDIAAQDLRRERRFRRPIIL